MATSITSRGTNAARSRQLGWAIVGLTAATFVATTLPVGLGEAVPDAGAVLGAALALAGLGLLTFAALRGSTTVSSSARVAAPSVLAVAVVLLVLALVAALLGGVTAVLWATVGAGVAFGLASVPGIAR